MTVILGVVPERESFGAKDFLSADLGFSRENRSPTRYCTLKRVYRPPRHIATNVYRPPRRQRARTIAAVLRGNTTDRTGSEAEVIDAEVMPSKFLETTSADL